MSIHKDAPITLAKLLAKLKQQCQQRVANPTVDTLNDMINFEAMLNRLSHLFARLVELIPGSIEAIHGIFNNALPNGIIDDKKIETINNLVYKHLEDYFNQALPYNEQCKKRIYNLCLDAVDQTSHSDSELISEWFSAIRLLNLNTLLAKLYMTNNDELTKALKPEHSFHEAYQSLYRYFKQCIEQTIYPVKELENSMPGTSQQHFKTPKPRPTTNFLLSHIDAIFQDCEHAPKQIPKEFAGVLSSFREQLGQQGAQDIQYTERLNTLIASLKRIEQIIQGLIGLQQPKYQPYEPGF